MRGGMGRVRHMRRVRRLCLRSRRFCGRVRGRCERFSLRMGRFDFAHQLVGFLLRHLAAPNHVLEQIARTLEDEAGQSGGGTDDVLHGCGHLAARLQADLVRLRRHLGDGIFYVSSAVAWAPPWRDQRCAGGARCSGCAGYSKRAGRADGWGRCCWSSNSGCFFSIGHLWAPVSATGWC